MLLILHIASAAGRPTPRATRIVGIRRDPDEEGTGRGIIERISTDNVLAFLIPHEQDSRAEPLPARCSPL